MIVMFGVGRDDSKPCLLILLDQADLFRAVVLHQPLEVTVPTNPLPEWPPVPNITILAPHDMAFAESAALQKAKEDGATVTLVHDTPEAKQ